MEATIITEAKEDWEVKTKYNTLDRKDLRELLSLKNNLRRNFVTCEFTQEDLVLIEEVIEDKVMNIGE